MSTTATQTNRSQTSTAEISCFILMLLGLALLFYALHMLLAAYDPQKKVIAYGVKEAATPYAIAGGCLAYLSLIGMKVAIIFRRSKAAEERNQASAGQSHREDLITPSPGMGGDMPPTHDNESSDAPIASKPPRSEPRRKS